MGIDVVEKYNWRKWRKPVEPVKPIA